MDTWSDREDTRDKSSSTYSIWSVENFTNESSPDWREDDWDVSARESPLSPRPDPAGRVTPPTPPNPPPDTPSPIPPAELIYPWSMDDVAAALDGEPPLDPEEDERTPPDGLYLPRVPDPSQLDRAMGLPRVYDAGCFLDRAIRESGWQLAEAAHQDRERLLGCVQLMADPDNYGDGNPQPGILDVPVWRAYGCDPTNARRFTPSAEERLVSLLRADERAVAVGPTGLDFAASAVDIVEQESALTRCLDVASHRRCPVIVICRNAANTVQAYDHLASFLKRAAVWDLRICLLAYDSTTSVVRALIETFPNVYFGITPALAHLVNVPLGAEAKNVMRFIPLERILLSSLAPLQASAPWGVAYVCDTTECQGHRTPCARCHAGGELPAVLRLGPLSLPH